MEKQKRNTKTKQMVMSVLQNSPSALCHDDIEQKLINKIDRVTIYRILQSFCDDGKVHKIASENGKTYYALCHCCSSIKHDDNHIHFHCIQCDTITCLQKSIIIPEISVGYSISGISIIISGHCPDCNNTTSGN